MQNVLFVFTGNVFVVKNGKNFNSIIFQFKKKVLRDQSAGQSIQLKDVIAHDQIKFQKKIHKFFKKFPPSRKFRFHF